MSISQGRSNEILIALLQHVFRPCVSNLFPKNFLFAALWCNSLLLVLKDDYFKILNSTLLPVLIILFPDTDQPKNLSCNISTIIFPLMKSRNDRILFFQYIKSNWKGKDASQSIAFSAFLFCFVLFGYFSRSSSFLLLCWIFDHSKNCCQTVTSFLFPYTPPAVFSGFLDCLFFLLET